MSPSGWILLLGFPAIVVAAVLYPAYAVQRYRVILKGGRAEAYRRLRLVALVVFAGSMLGAYAVAFATVFADAFPGLRRLMADGGLGLIVPLILVDILLGSLFSENRAVGAYRTRSGVSGHEGGDRGTNARIP